MKWIRGFNQHPGGRSFHCFLDTYLSVRIVLRVLYRWFQLNFAHWQLRRVESAFRPQGSNASLWPIMRRDWHRSLCGADAVSNLLWIELFDAALRTLPRQRQGLYLCEGQAWERAFIHAWRKYGHGQLIGVAHSTVRFWDLRYFADPRTTTSSGPRAMPRPDVAALNGKAALNAYLQALYPQTGVAGCEAVRYGYLSELRPRLTRQVPQGAPTRVLVLGDIEAKSTAKLLRLLAAAIETAPGELVLAFKPHPFCAVKADQYPTLNLTVLTAALGGILHDFDVAYCSASTSAAVDAYLAGLSVVVVLDEAGLNLSPLRARPGVRFVASAEELAASLRLGDDACLVRRDRNEFFFLDPGLPRWRKLLGLESICNV
jgi:surface carbohydrate biosynthesis protein (TIGR04326 family)